MTIYIVSNANDKELPIFVGNIEEVCKFMGSKKSVIYCQVSRKSLVKRKYHIESVEIGDKCEY